MVDNRRFAVVLVAVAVCRTLRRYPEAAPTKKVMKKGRSFTIAYVIVFYRCLLVTGMNTTLEKVDTIPTKFEPLLTRRFFVVFDNLECPSYLVKLVHLPPITKDRTGNLEVVTFAGCTDNTLAEFVTAIELEKPVTIHVKLLDPVGIVMHHYIYDNAILESCDLGTLAYENDAKLIEYILSFKVSNPRSKY